MQKTMMELTAVKKSVLITTISLYIIFSKQIVRLEIKKIE